MVNWRWIGYNVDTGRQLGILCPFQKASFFFFFFWHCHCWLSSANNSTQLNLGKLLSRKYIRKIRKMTDLVGSPKLHCLSLWKLLPFLMLWFLSVTLRLIFHAKCATFWFFSILSPIVQNKFKKSNFSTPISLLPHCIFKYPKM